MNGFRKPALAAAAVALAIGGTLAVSSASAAPQAPTGSTATTTAWAKVSAAGALLGGSGVTGVSHFGNGRYNITTTADLGECALLGTVNTNGGSDPGPGSSSVLVGKVSSNTLFIRTATPSSAGSAAVDSDRPFSITIVC
ncbi:hypothetical protein AB0D08_28250 [Kitasatospora sp. NPDC048540]|uniref:hypothetical protein n=1 Tax=Kitasatospora sp. NPDC048540 TaxID=3155634 RepID=UPI0033EB88B5